MPVLHIVRLSPHRSSDLERALATATRGAHVLLVQDAVTAAADTEGGRALAARAREAGVAVHALREDLAARGVARVAEGIDVVDYGAWVDLVEAHVPVTW